MATLKHGINGPFSGKVGSVVGSSWRGIPYIKGKQRIKGTKPKPTHKQASQHRKFVLLNRFLRNFPKLLEIGFGAYTRKATAMNVAFSYNYDQAFVERADELVLNYPVLQFSRGSLYTAGAEKAYVENDGIQVRWNPRTFGVGGAMDDLACVIVFSHSKQIHWNAAAYRSQGGVFVDWGMEIDVNDLHVWLFFSDASGKRASKTVYLPLVAAAT